MNRLNTLRLFLLVFLAILALSIIIQTTMESMSPSLEGSVKQEVKVLGDQIAADFKIYNPFGEPRLYTYSLYLNDRKRYENSVTVNPKTTFIFGGRYRVKEPGENKVTAVVYEGNKQRLIKNITYFVNVSS